MSVSRIRKEMIDLENDIKFSNFFMNYENLICTVVFLGPEDSPFEGIQITVKIVYPKQYPFQPPLIRFDPVIFHPNVTSVGTLIVESLSNSSGWSPGMQTSMLLQNILSLLYEPFICEEKLKKNNKGKEEDTEILNDKCVNMEALTLWQDFPDEYRQIIVLSMT